jgi:hypothetical protein
MAVSAATSERSPRATTLVRSRAVAPLGLGVLAALSILLRTGRFDVGYWIDEGLSVGIADRPLLDIPGVLRQDGSPPLYYLLLHVWIRLFGSTGETTTHALSLLLATLTIPLAYVLVRSLAGTPAGWIAAVLFAFVPFLTQYAQETRMYALVMLLGLLSVTAFAGAFVHRRGRRWVLGFAAAHLALLYTHNWGLFVGAGLALAWALLVALEDGPGRRGLVRDGLLAAAVIAVLYLPWVSTLLYQAAHTGAPWANPPTLVDFVRVPHRLFGPAAHYVLLVGVAIGFAPLARTRVRAWDPASRTALVALVVAVATALLPWVISQASPTWAGRYLSAVVPPLVLLCAVGLARAGVTGFAVAALAAALWVGVPAPGVKSNVRDVTATLAPSLAPGDLVVSTQPEQVPVLHHYLGAQDVTGLRWGTLWGPVEDVGVADWRDGTDRVDATSPRRDLAPLLDSVRPGQRVLLVMPDVSDLRRWRAPWTSRVRQKSAAWEDWLRRDGRFRVVRFESAAPPTPPNSLRALLALREPVG